MNFSFNPDYQSLPSPRMEGPAEERKEEASKEAAVRQVEEEIRALEEEPRPRSGSLNLVRRKATRKRLKSLEIERNYEKVIKNPKPFLKKLTMVVQLIMGLTSVSLTISAFFFWNSTTVRFDETAQNWLSAPISDIQLVSKNAFCPSDYIQIEGKFLGTNFLCDCGANDIRLASCSDSEDKCFTVSHTPEMTLDTWRFFKICIQRHPSGTEVNSVNRMNNCHLPNWKNCSSSGNSSLCVPQDTPCPLTSFSITHDGPSRCPAGSEASPAFSQPSSDLPSTASSIFLCKSRDGERPLVDFFFSMGGECVEAVNYNPFSKSNPQKGISASSRDVSTPPFACGQSIYDRRYIDVDIRMMGTVMNDNKATIQSRLKEDQANYWTNLPYPLFYKLQVRPEIPFSQDCPVDKYQLIDAKGHMDQISVSQTGMVILSLLTDIFISIPWHAWAAFQNPDKAGTKSVSSIVKGVSVILSNSLTVVFIALSFYSISQLQRTFPTALKNGCSDVETDVIFKSYSDEIWRTFWLDLFLGLWAIFEMGMEIRAIIVLPTKKQKSEPAVVEMHDVKRPSFHSRSSESK